MKRTISIGRLTFGIMSGQLTVFEDHIHARMGSVMAQVTRLAE